MGILENISLAVTGLLASKMRALLTMLGIIIGIGSVIAIVTLGDSLTSTVNDTMAGIGINNITIYIQERSSSMNSTTSIEPSDLITQEMIDEFNIEFDSDLEAIGLDQSIGSGKVKDGRRYSNISEIGVNDQYIDANNVEMLAGRFITERDVTGYKNTAVVSNELVKKLFRSNDDALGKEIKVYVADAIQTFTVVGVYENKPIAFMFGSANAEDITTNLFIPITTAKKFSGADDGFYQFMATAKTGVDTKTVSEEFSAFFETKYYAKNPRVTVRAFSMDSMLEQANTMLSTMTIGLSAIAAIALLVGGIGVMNIMLVSVTERTREIGTRKALGARNSAIRIQFIVESMIICLIGGAIGVVFGSALGLLGSNLLGFPSTPSVAAIIVAVSFSLVIGVFFGYYPANKAAKLDPIEALRYE